MVPELILAQKGCPGIYGHRNGARTQMCTGMVSGHKWALEGYPVTYGHRKGAQAHIGAKMARGTFEHWKGAQVHMGNGREPGYK